MGFAAKEVRIVEMFSPAHPGEVIREDCLQPLGLTVTAAAAGLGVAANALSEVRNGRCGVSAEMAIRLEKAGWTTAEHWLLMQMQFDLWHARQLPVAVARFPGVGG